LKKLLIYLRDYKKESILAPAFKMLEATFDLLVPLVMAAIINTGIANKDKGYILSHCGLLILLGVIGLTCSITAQYFAAKASVGFCTKVRHVLFSHIQSLGFAEMDKLGTSTLITRMTSDINQVQSGLNLFLRLFLRSPFIVFGSIVMAFIVSPKAAVIFVVTIPLLSIVVFGIMLITMPLYRKVQGSLDGILGVTRENLTGVRVIRAFGREEQEKDRFEENNGLLVRSQLLVGKISALMNPLTYVMINLAVVVILNTGAVQIHLGNMQQGDVVALVNYMNQILIELVKLANLIIQVTKAMACAERVASVLNVEPEMEFSCLENNAKNRKTGTSDEEVAFDHVSFTYGGAGAETLSNIHFTVKKGQTVGIIGGTGSGKSTLVNLLARFYDATDGQIRIGGHDIRSYSREELRGKIGMVMQKAQLFSGTIRSNLLWGNPGATDEMLWAALETAQAAEFVQKKEKQLDEPVEQGGRNLSGGQKQRLTIARALVEDPEILILDDSASALDFATDAALRKAIRELDKEMTVFIVSQRTSSLMHADLILVLDDGKTVGMGTHEELLGNCPVYQEIYESQFGKAGETA
jgi:ATP-binding cassette subfamily B multidrug efflux pump